MARLHDAAARRRYLTILPTTISPESGSVLSHLVCCPALCVQLQAEPSIETYYLARSMPHSAYNMKHVALLSTQGAGRNWPTPGWRCPMTGAVPSLPLRPFESHCGHSNLQNFRFWQRAVTHEAACILCSRNKLPAMHIHLGRHAHGRCAQLVQNCVVRCTIHSA